MASGIDLTIATAFAEIDLQRIETLLKQLSSTATFDPERLPAMVDLPGVDLLVAREAGRIVGMATLVIFPLVTGWRGAC